MISFIDWMGEKRKGRDDEEERNENILLVIIILNAVITYAFCRFLAFFLPLPSIFSLSPSRPSSFHKCRSMLLSEYYKNTFFIAMKIKAAHIHGAILCNPWCVSLFPISFLLAASRFYISTHAFFSPSSFTIFFSEFFIFLRRCALFFISCNIFLCFSLYVSRLPFIQILFLYFLRTFCKFLWMEKLFSFCFFSSYYYETKARRQTSTGSLIFL